MDELASYSEQTIRQGSKSFAKAAMLFDRRTRDSVTMLYAWCRHCDDVIDGQTLGHGLQSQTSVDKLRHLQHLQRETARICDGHSSDEPAFAALQRVVARHDIPRKHLFELLEGFELDAREVRFRTIDDTLHYCYHVAGVVGVMMARIMGVLDEDAIHRATDLGIAFQLTNIARDVKDDLSIGRCYLPEEWLHRKNLPLSDINIDQHQAALHELACELLDLAERYYASAKLGIAYLPRRCAWAIASALLIYRDIGTQVRNGGADAWNRRAQVSKGRKLRHLCQGGLVAARTIGQRTSRPPAARAGLWTKQAASAE